VVEPGDDFDDIQDETLREPLLPPDDRLWRHPSELGKHARPVTAETLSARRSWMAATPSRAGAWSAGIVGALLATGVVLVGGHLTHVLSPSQGSLATTANSSHKLIGSRIDPETSSTIVVATTTTMVVSLESGVRKLAARIAGAMPVVLDGDASGVGVVIDSRGYVLVPSSLVTNTNDISLIIDGQQLVATLVGIDEGTGLAVVRVHDLGALTATRFASDPPIGSGSFVALVWVGRDGTHTCWGTVRGVDVRLTATDDSPPLLDSLQTLDPAPGMAAGGVVIDGAGRPIGMVTSVAGDVLLATPGWLADVVSRDLIARGRVVHGWLGFTGETASAPGAGTAVKVLSVKPGGAAAKAGVKPGDLIETVNGEPVKTMSDMVAALYVLPPHHAVVLRVVSHGHPWAARARLAPAA